jgi:hypothetical protein
MHRPADWAASLRPTGLALAGFCNQKTGVRCQTAAFAAAAHGLAMTPPVIGIGTPVVAG